MLIGYFIWNLEGVMFKIEEFEGIWDMEVYLVGLYKVKWKILILFR